MAHQEIQEINQTQWEIIWKSPNKNHPTSLLPGVVG
jgi:hypothetical protein